MTLKLTSQDLNASEFEQKTMLRHSRLCTQEEPKYLFTLSLGTRSADPI